jgi:hypothetical protein
MRPLWRDRVSYAAVLRRLYVGAGCWRHTPGPGGPGGWVPLRQSRPGGPGGLPRPIVAASAWAGRLTQTPHRATKPLTSHALPSTGAVATHLRTHLWTKPIPHRGRFHPYLVPRYRCSATSRIAQPRRASTPENATSGRRSVAVERSAQPSCPAVGGSLLGYICNHLLFGTQWVFRSCTTITNPTLFVTIRARYTIAPP